MYQNEHFTYASSFGLVDTCQHTSDGHVQTHRRPQRLPKGGANSTKAPKEEGYYRFCNLSHLLIAAQMSVNSYFTHSYM